MVVPADKVTQYIPSTRPGARFPHVDFQKNTAPSSSHDLLDYRLFTILLREKGTNWQTALQQFPAAIQQKINVVRLDQLGLSENVYHQLLELCAIEETGALLIRPDGHVAWRTKVLNENAEEELRQVFQHFFKVA